MSPIVGLVIAIPIFAFGFHYALKLEKIDHDKQYQPVDITEKEAHSSSSLVTSPRSAVVDIEAGGVEREKL